MIGCDRCHFRGLPEEVREHKRTAHSERQNGGIPQLIDVHLPIRRDQQYTKPERQKARPKPVRKPADSRERNQTIARGSIKSAVGAKRVTIKAIPKAEADRQKAMLAVPIPGRKKSVRCSRCQAAMKATNFVKHLARVHGVGGRQLNKNARKNPDRPVEARDSVRILELGGHRDDLQIMDKREAHRQMGFVVRENGRYGSHPLHDRFDDESEP